jgi:alcohol dehydrogenase
LRAIRLNGSGVVLDGRAEPPALGAGEAFIRPLRMSISPSDARLAAARHASGHDGAPLTLGQEFVGIVERLHDSADRDLRKRWEGKRIVGAVTIACGRCDMCRAGFSPHCRDKRTLGAQGWDGCFAEAFKLPIRNLVEVPAAIDDDHAVFASALAGALHTAQLVRVEGKPYITILGDNADGLLCAQVMARMNASVRLLGSRPGKFTLCEKWSIKHRHINEVGRRGDQDIVVDCTGSAASLALALQLVRPRGKVMLRQAPAGDQHIPLDLLVDNEIELLGARIGSLADALAVLARGEIDVLSLITRRARLSDGPAALAAAANPEQVKVLLDPT